MDHGQGAAQFSIPTDERMMGFRSVGPLVAIVSAHDDVQQAAGWPFAGIVFRGEDLTVAAGADSKRIPEALRDSSQIGKDAAVLFGAPVQVPGRMGQARCQTVYFPRPSQVSNVSNAHSA